MHVLQKQLHDSQSFYFWALGPHKMYKKFFLWPKVKKTICKLSGAKKNNY